MSDHDGDVERLTRARLRQLRALNTAKGRREQRRFLLDGAKLVRDAIAAGAPIEELLSESPQDWVDHGLRVTKLTRADSERLSDTRTPQGHFAVVRDELQPPSQPGGERWMVIALDGVQDAGNVGSIIRSAAAFGVDSVLFGAGSADPTHPRVVRAATGAWFQTRLSRASELSDSLKWLKAEGAAILAADQLGKPLDALKPPDKQVWVFGSEGAGIDAELDPLVDERVAVPMSDAVESLNVGVAAAIILHHVYMQRREERRP